SAATSPAPTASWCRRRAEFPSRAWSAYAGRSSTARSPRPCRGAEQPLPMDGQPMTPIVLKVYDGGKLKSSRAFHGDRIAVGSGAADLVLDGPGVAPSHALIEQTPVGVVLRALGTAPVHLNGQP